MKIIEHQWKSMKTSGGSRRHGRSLKTNIYIYIYIYLFGQLGITLQCAGPRGNAPRGDGHNRRSSSPPSPPARGVALVAFVGLTQLDSSLSRETVAERPPMWTRLLASPLHQDSAATTGRSLEECATTSGRPPERAALAATWQGSPQAGNPRLSAPLHYPGRPHPLWMNKASNVSVGGWSTAAANPRWVSSMGPSPYMHIYIYILTQFNNTFQLSTFKVEFTLNL